RHAPSLFDRALQRLVVRREVLERAVLIAPRDPGLGEPRLTEAIAPTLAADDATNVRSIVLDESPTRVVTLRARHRLIVSAVFYFCWVFIRSVGDDFTSAVDRRCSQSSRPRAISRLTYSMNSLTSLCICSIFLRMFRMISTPARLTPRSRVSDRMVS